MAIRDFDPGTITARELKTIIRWDVMEEIGPHAVRRFRLRLMENPSEVYGGMACVWWKPRTNHSPVMFVCRRSLFLSKSALDRLFRHEIIHLKRIHGHGADFNRIAEAYGTKFRSITRNEMNEADRAWKRWKCRSGKGVSRKRRRKRRRSGDDGPELLERLFPLN